MQLLSTGFSEIGPVRKTNEDAMLDHREQGLFVVADGMGGHRNGRMAAQTLCRSLALFRRQVTVEDSRRLIERLIHEANAQIFERGNGESGATFCVLLLQDDLAQIFWAGDTRAYCIAHREISQLSEDHVSNIRGNVSRAVGVTDELDIAVKEIATTTRDTFILATDGFYRAISDSRLHRVLCQYPLQTAANMLRHRALINGTTDNYSALFIRKG